MQTILGSNGAIGNALAKALTAYTTNIRLVSRNPKKVNENDQLLSADLTTKEGVFKAIEGSEVAYLCIGLEYKLDIWKTHWPPMMRNVLDACELYGCKLVFVDNVYAIGGDNVQHITEESPISPSSKKGKIRAQVDQMILDEIAAGKVKAIIARCADYYGPFPDLSLPMIATYGNFKKGKKAQWLFQANIPHTYTYTPDAGKGMALLGNTPDAYNQIWNLPTTARGITGEDWVNMVAKEMKVPAKFTSVPAWLVKVLGIFVPVLNEVHEMKYQFDRPYFFDSSKFEKQFNIKPTPYEVGIKETIAELSSKV